MAYRGTNTTNYNFFQPDDNSSGWGSAMRSFIRVVDDELGKLWKELRDAKNRMDLLERGTITANFAFKSNDTKVDFAATAGTDKGVIEGYFWTFGDGNSGSGQTVSHTYVKTGAYLTTLLAVSSSGVSKLVSRTVKVESSVPSSLDASFTASVSDSGLVTFAAVAGVSDGVVDSYSWSFGDNLLGSGPNPSHTYTQSGTYNVMLTVKATTRNGTLTKTVSKSVTPRFIADNAPSYINADFLMNLGHSGAVTLTASASTTRGYVTGYSWSFGDGTPGGVGSTIAHTYANTGPFMITLTVSDSTGNSAIVSKQVSPLMTAPPATPSVIQVDFAPTNGTTPGLVHFTASASSDKGAISLYSWSFGDDTAGAGQSASHIYAGNGPYNVTLTVQDATGATKQVVKQVTPPAQTGEFSADFTYQKTVGTDEATKKPIERYTFNAAQTNPNNTIASYVWAFQGGTPAGYQAPNSQTYSALSTWPYNGTYNVTLTVTHTDGRKKEITKAITVTEALPEPIATMTYEGSRVTGDEQVAVVNAAGETSHQIVNSNDGLLGRRGEGGSIRNAIIARPEGFATKARLKITSVEAYILRTFSDSDPVHEDVVLSPLELSQLNLFAADGYEAGTTSLANSTQLSNADGWTMEQFGNRAKLYISGPIYMTNPINVTKIVISVV